MNNIADDLVRAFNDGYEKGKVDAEAYIFHCGDTDEPSTNGDRIRRMNNEELASFLWNRDMGILEKVSKTVGITFRVNKERCLSNVLDWLKQEVE